MRIYKLIWYGLTIPVLKFENKMILLSVSMSKQTADEWHLIWVYTVGTGLSVPILTVNTVKYTLVKIFSYFSHISP